MDDDTKMPEPAKPTERPTLPPMTDIFHHIVWWLMYHGDENPVKLWREVKQKGYHDCHPCPNPHHPQNRKDFYD